MVAHKSAGLTGWSFTYAACASGAQLSRARPEVIEALRRYGELLGVAFQMADDMVDFSASSGKPLGLDIRQRVLSLPLIYAAEDREVGPEVRALLAGSLGDAEVARVAKQFNAPIRVNVYQSVRTDVFALSYEEYWEGFRRLFAETDVIMIGEPLVRAMSGLPPLAGGCGVGTVRVTPRATTQACVYWSGGGEPLSRLLDAGEEIVNTPAFVAARLLPSACEPCEFRETCHGGCAGRRQLQGALDEPDCYCPMIRGERPQLDIRMAAARDLPKIGSACTTVVIARD